MNRVGSTYRDIARRLEESANIQKALAKSNVIIIAEIAECIVTSYKAGGKVILFGNGGSAADAQHLACELVGKFELKRQPFPAIALSSNISILTALANDYGYEAVFSRQLEALVNERDVVIGISTSGNSPNVVNALELARRKGAQTVALAGNNGGEIAGVADLVLTVPSSSTPRIQESHITIGHIICELVEKELAYPEAEEEPAGVGWFRTKSQP